MGQHLFNTRMRTVRCSGRPGGCPSMHWAWGCVSQHAGSRGVSAWGVCLPGGGVCPGGVYLGVCVCLGGVCHTLPPS